MKFGKIARKLNMVLALILIFVLACPAVYADDVAEDSIVYDMLFFADNNRDNVVDAGDALEVLKFACKLIGQWYDGVPESVGDLRIGDMNADGIVNAEDALLILKYAAKLINEFPFEELLDVTPEPTEDVTPEPTDDVTPEPTGETTSEPTDDVTPEPTEDITPEPTEEPNVLPDWIASLNDAATFDSETGVITFIEPGDETEGVEIVNPFLGQDPTLGGAFSFWINSPVTNIEGNDWGYDSLISIVNKYQNEIIKFDIQGTRQYSSTVDGSKLSMNYWNAYLPLTAGEDAFITCVVCYEGLKMYCNGTEIGQISYSGADDLSCRDLIKQMLTKEGTRIYIGGTAEVANTYLDICKQSLYEGVKVWDFETYNYSMSPEEAKNLYYEVMLESGKVTPSPEPTMDPAEATKAIPAEVISLNDVATMDGTTFTFNDPFGYEDGVEIVNPLAGVTDAEGGTFSFWFTPAVDYDGQAYTYTSLMMLVNPAGTDLLKFDCEGTRQFQDSINSKKLNYYATDAKLTAGTEYFITVTVHADGLDYFINGEKLEVGEWFSKEDQGTAKKRALNLLFASDSRLFIGGTACAPAKHVSLVKHKLPEGTQVRDFYGYKSVLSDEYIKDLYNSLLTGEPMPTEEPVTTEAPALEWTDVTVKALNDVATYENGTYTMGAAPADGTGVQLENPFIGKTLTGATISYWLNPGTNTYSQYDSVAVIAFAKGNDASAKYIKVDLSGTGQFREANSNAYNWWNCTAGNPVSGTEIFVTVVIGEDSTVKYYVNGVQYIANADGGSSQATLSSSVINDILTHLTTDAEMYIGGYATLDSTNIYIKNRLPQGTTIRNIKTYDAALTADEVAELYKTNK